jgi:thiol-disulfide isomerase/thioredoxin
MIKRTSMLIGILALMLAGPSLIAEVGDPAPPLKVDWIRGGPHDLKAGKGKNVFVLEFWATWCGPCRMSMPHLTELQKKYKDKGLVIIGVAMGDEPAPVIKTFLNQMGDKIDFSVAQDQRNDTARAYLLPLHVNAIPYSFVIDKDGVLAWHGSPFGGLDQVIEQCLAGTYNVKARSALMKYFQTAVEADMATNPTQKKDQAKKAREIGDDLLKIAAKSPDVLDALAWNILRLPQLKTRDMDLARKASKAAYDATEGKDASVLDTYASILWDAGEKTEAVKQEKAAIALTKDDQMLAMFKQRLKEYETVLKIDPPTSAPATQASR